MSGKKGFLITVIICSLMFSGLSIIQVGLSGDVRFTDNHGEEMEKTGNEPGFGPDNRAASVSMGPYLNSLLATGVTVCFVTDTAVAASVEYGPTAAYGYTASESAALANHQISLSGLQPDTTYHYRISYGNYSSSDYSFTTAQGYIHPYDFLVYGDTRTNHTAHQMVVNQAMNYGGDFLMNTGDLVSDGENPADWPPFFEDIQPYAQNHSYWPCLGNHENDAALYYQYFSLPGNEKWYSFDYGQTHFIVLDSNNYLNYMQGSEQYNWLKSDLQANQQDWKFIFVMLHHPPYSGSNRDPNYDVRNTLCPLFEQYGVDVVFNGHDHYYCHSYANGIHYVVSGGGGAPLYDPKENGETEHMVYAEKTYQFVQISVDNGYCTLRAVRAEDGSEMENFTIEVQNKAPGTPNIWALDTPFDNGGSINVEWTANVDDGGGENDVQNYYLYRMDSVGQQWSLLATLEPGTEKYTDTDVEHNVSYYYTMVVTDGVYSVPGNVVGPISPVDDTPPEPPTGLVAEDVKDDNGGTVRVSWQKSPAHDVNSYYVYRNTQNTGFTNETLVGIVPYTATQYTDVGLNNQVPYYYTVKAWDGTHFSDKSNVYGPVVAKWDGAPRPPTAFSAKDVEDDDGGVLELSWTLSLDDGQGDDDVVEYHMYRRREGTSFGLEPNITVDSGTYEHLDSYVENDIDYYYYIVSFDGHLESREWNEIGPVRPINNHIPALVKGLSSSNVRDLSLKLSWDANLEPYVEGYKLYVNASPVMDNIYFGEYTGEYQWLNNVEQTVSSTISETVTGLRPSITYCFKVVSYSESGAQADFDDSPTIKVTTLNPPNIDSVEITPDPVYAEASTPVKIEVAVKDLDGATDVSSVHLDLSSLGRGTTQMFDDSTHGDSSALDGTYTYEFELPEDIEAGVYSMEITALDKTQLERSAAYPLEVMEKVINNAPFIESEVPDPERIITMGLGDNKSFKVVAEDGDDDPLTYVWSANNDIVGSNASSFTFQPSEAREYAIKVKIKDGHNPPVEIIWSVSVVSDEKPEEEEEVVEKKDEGWDYTSAALAAAAVIIILFVVLIIFKYGGKGPDGEAAEIVRPEERGGRPPGK